MKKPGKIEIPAKYILAFLSVLCTAFIVLQGFVYAPKYDKRHYLRQVESIIYSFEWAKNENN